MLRIALENEGPFILGSTLAGQLHWQPGSDTRYKGASVTLGWRTEGRGTAHKARVAGLQGDASGSAGPDGLDVDFSFVLPATGPVSYDGSVLRIIWYLDARIDIPWAIDDTATMDILVLDRSA